MSAALVVDGVRCAPLEVAGDSAARRRGLLGRDGLEGALWLAPAKQVHSFRMRFDLDIAFVDPTGLVLHVQALPRNRITRIVWRARGVIEAEHGSFLAWGLQTGSRVQLP
ncbi:DUF192 domain-containing protein [Euzebya tangerina]|uniref:DUF192 domain-containing protein n=1 Tax=Euzebya tangerina TaxID=591198 RepID=UPI000E30F02B|nr:DUF192 domain-containing protein [Euzebya tangerina]